MYERITPRSASCSPLVTYGGGSAKAPKRLRDGSASGSSAWHLGERVGHVVVASAHQPERRRPDDLQRLAVERPAAAWEGGSGKGSTGKGLLILCSSPAERRAACARPADRTAPDDGAVGEQRHLRRGGRPGGAAGHEGGRWRDPRDLSTLSLSLPPPPPPPRAAFWTGRAGVPRRESRPTEATLPRAAPPTAPTAC